MASPPAYSRGMGVLPFSSAITVPFSVVGRSIRISIGLVPRATTSSSPGGCQIAAFHDYRTAPAVLPRFAEAHTHAGHPADKIPFRRRVCGRDSCQKLELYPLLFGVGYLLRAGGHLRPAPSVDESDLRPQPSRGAGGRPWRHCPRPPPRHSCRAGRASPRLRGKPS